MNFFKFLRFDVGDGTRVKFWEDEWCRNCSLKVAFLEFYSFSRTKESLMSKVMWFFDGRLHWDIQFCRPPQDWEEVSVDLFWDVLYSTNV